eukprot:6194725-Pleurochrysis_carterae.AAC.5
MMHAVRRVVLNATRTAYEAAAITLCHRRYASTSRQALSMQEDSAAYRQEGRAGYIGSAEPASVRQQ